MFKLFPARIITTLILLAGLVACNLPGAATPTATLAPTAVPATATESIPPTDTPIPASDTPAPTDTPSATDTPTLPPEPTATETPALLTARLLKETICRSGPAGNYDPVATYQTGTVLEIIGKDLGGYFWLVRDLASPDQTCWALMTNVEASGDTSAVTIAEAPSSPTPQANFTIEYKNADVCKGPFMRFTVVNTGGVQFRSAYIKITDQKTGEISELSVLAFDLTDGCVLARNIAPLKPGGTGYLQSGPFKKPFAGHKIQAVFMLCSEQSLSGACVTQVLNFSAK